VGVVVLGVDGVLVDGAVGDGVGVVAGVVGVGVVVAGVVPLGVVVDGAGVALGLAGVLLAPPALTVGVGLLLEPPHDTRQIAISNPAHDLKR